MALRYKIQSSWFMFRHPLQYPRNTLQYPRNTSLYPKQTLQYPRHTPKHPRNTTGFLTKASRYYNLCQSHTPDDSDTDIFVDQVTNFDMSRDHYTPSDSSLSVGTQRESSTYDPETNAGYITDCNSWALEPFIPIPSQRGAK